MYPSILHLPLFRIFTLLRLSDIILSVIRLEERYMREKSYHHGDLQRTLIETGIEFIKQDG